MFDNKKSFYLSECRTGLDFENWTALLLTSIGFEAKRVGGADNGVDIIAVWTDSNKRQYKFYIQCKYYNRPVGNAPIQEVYTGTHYYGDDGQPVVITNSRVTESAKAFAKKMGVEVIDDLCLNELKISGKTKKCINTSHTGLMGILLSHILRDSELLQKSVKKYNQPQDKPIPTDKEKLKQELIDTFDQAEIYEQEAARLQMEASQFHQKSIALQREALLRNLDYG